MPKCISIIHGLLTCVVLYCLQTKLDCIVVKNDEEGKDLFFFSLFWWQLRYRGNELQNILWLSFGFRGSFLLLFNHMINFK